MLVTYFLHSTAHIRSQFFGHFVMTEAQILMQAVQQAATAASEAAKALRAMGVEKKKKKKKKKKTIWICRGSNTKQCPKEFGHAIPSEDATNYVDFSFFLKQWLCFAAETHRAGPKHAVANAEAAADFNGCEVSRARPSNFYAILSQIFLLRNHFLKVFRRFRNDNGFEVCNNCWPCPRRRQMSALLPP